ncbi:MAG: hypothetical protein ABW166_18355 [Sedimenticola sp.]
MTQRSCEAITKLLASTKVVEFKDLQVVLENASRATTFRYLKQVPYLRSYNHNGRYYTRKDPARHDRLGLFSCGNIHFSHDRTVGETIKRLVYESIAGWTSRELQDALHVRVQVFLLDAVRNATVMREKACGVYVYIHTDSAVGEMQLQQRRMQMSARERAPINADIDREAIIAVLLTLLHHPEAQEADVAHTLRGHSPPISMSQVAAVYIRYDLASVGKKGGTSKY